MDDQYRDLLHRILRAAVREDASDIYIRAGIPPHLRVEGELVAIDMDPLTDSVTETMAYEIMPPHMRDAFQNKPEANLVYHIPEIGRFRANIYLQRQSIAMVLRKVREDILDLEMLRIPPVTKQLAMLKRGLVICCGPTGSGKSTTLASMIRYRNENTTGHIVTIEDPIEYIHTDIRCIISQREVGSDTLNFADALESAVRQAPDVLLVGEMRDIESVRAAVYFAETGHLVLSTLHSNNAVQAIERIMGFFPSEIHEQVLGQLALNTRAIVCQRLVPRKDGVGRVVAIEIMIVNARMQELLAKGQLTQIKRELDQFLPDGMQSFDHSLLELVKSDLITQEDAIRTSDNPNDMRLKLRTNPVYRNQPSQEPAGYGA